MDHTFSTSEAVIMVSGSLPALRPSRLEIGAL